MSDFIDNYSQHCRDGMQEAEKFIEASNGLYTNADYPAFLAGYLAALSRLAKNNDQAI